MKNVCVIGSLNMDMVLSMNKLPQLGETLIANQIETVNGGKGGNQACAASRLGCHVTMIGCIGDDAYGSILYKGLEQDGIRTKYIKRVKGPSGMAIITVDQDGNNTIAVVPGANNKVTTSHIEEVKDIIQESHIVISQFETPMEATELAFRYAKEAGCITLLNPAPFAEVTKELLENTDIIIPNETEVHELTGILVNDEASAKQATKSLFDQGIRYAIITLGADGAILVSKERCKWVPAFKVSAIDTTAAGDSFIGAIASKLTQDMLEDFDKVLEIISFGNRVSSITVTREGAQSSIPTLEEVHKHMKEGNR